MSGSKPLGSEVLEVPDELSAAIDRAECRDLWAIFRHGGRGTDTWRNPHSFWDEQRARSKFEQMRLGVRQGGIALVNPGGIVELLYTAPRVRTRW